MDVTLSAEIGRVTGSRNAGRLRAEGKVPGTVYGLGSDPVSVAVPWPDLRRALTTDAGLNALITLDFGDQQDFIIVKDMQRDPVRRDVLHVDFLRVDPNVLVEVEVPIVVIGEAKEIEQAKGIAEQQMKSLTVKAKPTGIPGHLEVDITDLGIGGTITVADVVLPEGVITEVDPTATIVAGSATRFSAAQLGEEEEGEETDAEGETGEASTDDAGE